MPDLHVQDLEGRNALHYLASWGDEPVAKLLLSHLAGQTCFR